MMTKNKSRILLAILLTVLFLMLAAGNLAAPVSSAQNTVAMQQTSPTPSVEDSSEIGSTNGILIMGIVIVMIVTLPLIFRKKG